MSGFDPTSLLDLVAQGESLTLLERAVFLLSSVHSELSVTSAWDWTVGERDRVIWQAWRQNYNNVIEAVSACPDCGERVEFTLPADFKPPAATSDMAEVDIDGHRCIFRLPTSRDLLSVEANGFDLLIEGELTEKITQKDIETALEVADPGLDTVISHNCPACATEWLQSFDVVRFIWQDCVQRSEDLLQDINTIASGYGWTEAEILALSAQRRNRYVALIREQTGISQQRFSSTGQVLS